MKQRAANRTNSNSLINLFVFKQNKFSSFRYDSVLKQKSIRTNFLQRFKTTKIKLKECQFYQKCFLQTISMWRKKIGIRYIPRQQNLLEGNLSAGKFLSPKKVKIVEIFRWIKNLRKTNEGVNKVPSASKYLSIKELSFWINK